MNYKNKDWLGYQYNELGKKQSEIAREQCVSQKTISKWMEKLGVGTRRKGGNRWKGGRHITEEGYMLIYKPDRLSSGSNGYIKEARFIMENELGRWLSPQEIVHHRDLDKLNNNIENLQIMSQSDHMKLHYKIKIFLKNL